MAEDVSFRPATETSLEMSVYPSLTTAKCDRPADPGAARKLAADADGADRACALGPASDRGLGRAGRVSRVRVTRDALAKRLF